MTDTPIAAPGTVLPSDHNNPPLVDQEAVANRNKAAFVCATAVLNAEEKLPAVIANAADLEVMAKHAKDALTAWNTLDGARKVEKQPFDGAASTIQGMFTPRLAKLEATKKLALSRITAWNNKVEEGKRIEAKKAADAMQEEANRRAEAAAQIEGKGMDDVAATIMDSALDAQADAQALSRIATGSAADLVRTVTGAGTVTSNSNLTFEVTDWPVVRKNLGALGDFIDAATIEKAIRAYLKGEKLASRHPALPGVRFYTDRSARVR